MCTAWNASQFPKPGMPEVVFLGRSNVGKSTLINALLNRLNKRVAFVSSKPGKTRSANFYKIYVDGADSAETNFCLVDMPGYGYAARSGDEREGWWKLVKRYFSGKRNTVFALHLVDFRHGPISGDIELTEWLDGLDMPRQIVFTKGDKVPRGRSKVFYGQYVNGGLTSILPPIVTRGKNDDSAEFVREAILRIIRELNNA
jgi:GTP-binding protein